MCGDLSCALFQRRRQGWGGIIVVATTGCCSPATAANRYESTKTLPLTVAAAFTTVWWYRECFFTGRVTSSTSTSTTTAGEYLGINHDIGHNNNAKGSHGRQDGHEHLRMFGRTTSAGCGCFVVVAVVVITGIRKRGQPNMRRYRVSGRRTIPRRRLL